MSTISRRLLLVLAVLLTLGVMAIYFGGRYFVTHWVETNLQDSAEKVRNVLMATRRVYHHQFIDSGLPVNDQTLGFLPAHALHRIAKDLEHWDKSGFSFNNVSDRPRNPFNRADAVEMAAIEHFRANPEAELRFMPFTDATGQPYYLYARPIRVEKYCLQCHGNKTEAPVTISKNYEEAFDYQEGDLRGILSIKIPATPLVAQARASLLALLGAGVILLGLLGVGIAWAVGRQVIRPLAVLERHIQQVAGGDLSQRVPRLPGEFGSVGAAYNRMAENLAREREERRSAEAALSQNATRLLEMHKIVESIAAVHDLSGLMAIISHALRGLIGADGATLILREGNQCHYVEEDAIRPLWKGQRFPMDFCVSGWAMKHAQAADIEDIHADARIPQDFYRDTFVKSLCIVPIGHLHPIGAIGCYWAQQHQPSAGEIDLQQALADAVAVALQNLDLYRGIMSAREAAVASAAALEAALQEQTAARRAALSVMEDAVAARTRAESTANELRESESRFRALVEQSAAGIYIVQDNRFRYVNPYFAQLAGYDSPQEIIDHVSFMDLVVPEQRAMIADKMRRRMAGDTSDNHYNVIGLRRDGTRIDIELHGNIIQYRGRPALIGLFIDVTARAAAEAELRLRNEELERFNRAVVGRELDMIELKRRINMLSLELGHEAPYDLNFLDTGDRNETEHGH